MPLRTSGSGSYRCDHRQLRVRFAAISAQRFCVSGGLFRWWSGAVSANSLSSMSLSFHWQTLSNFVQYAHALTHTYRTGMVAAEWKQISLLHVRYDRLRHSISSSNARWNYHHRFYSIQPHMEKEKLYRFTNDLYSCILCPYAHRYVYYLERHVSKCLKKLGNTTVYITFRVNVVIVNEVTFIAHRATSL